MSASPASIAYQRAAYRRRTITVDVEVDLADVIDELDDSALMEEARRRRLPVLQAAPTGITTAIPADHFIDAAYIAAEKMVDCPQAIRDLLWHVHGRAIA